MAASPTFAGSQAGSGGTGGGGVKLETGSSAATPRASLSAGGGGQSMTVPTSEQASRAVTPRASIVSATAEGVAAETEPSVPGAVNEKQERPPSIFDATHIPTLRDRIQSLTKLIIAASADAHSLSVAQPPRSGDSEAHDTLQTDSVSAGAAPAPAPAAVQDYAPNIALGAATDDDINSGYEAALSLSFSHGDAAAAATTQKQQPTVLAEALVREGTGLRDAFVRAQRAIAALDGGDMDVEEQEHLINLLRHYNDDQKSIRRSFVARSSKIQVANAAAATHTDDTRMAVD